jgi:2-C-methyl-D-erythritol 4-phosphate cytidylyltransferase
LLTLRQARQVDLVVVAVPPGRLAEVGALLASYLDASDDANGNGGTARLLVEGGDTRQASVSAMLAALPQDVDTVLVHDAARALTPPALVDAVADTVRAGAAAVVPALPVADTIKSVAESGDRAAGPEIVTGTLERRLLRAVQTPQGFRREVLERAHAAAAGEAATDDAGMVERLGEQVTVIPGHAEAFKVTTPFDVLLAEAVLATRREGALR